MTTLTDTLLAVPAPAAYAIVAALVFAEAALFVGFVLPGETAVLLGGVLAATGRLSLPVLIALVVIAAVAGDSVGYEVGRHLGPRVLSTRLLRRHAGRLDGARRMLRERGGWAVFLGRFTAFLRALVPALAGVSHLPYRRFLLFNAAGALVWGSGVVLLGFSAGHSYPAVERALGRTSAVLLAVVAVAVVAVVVRRPDAAGSVPAQGAQPRLLQAEGVTDLVAQDPEHATGHGLRGVAGAQDREPVERDGARQRSGHPATGPGHRDASEDAQPGRARRHLICRRRVLDEHDHLGEDRRGGLRQCVEGVDHHLLEDREGHQSGIHHRAPPVSSAVPAGSRRPVPAPAAGGCRRARSGSRR